MSKLCDRLAASPILPRVVPFVVFLVLTALQDYFGEAGRYWIYLLKTLVGAWLLWTVRLLVTEMKWAFSWEAVVVGIGVFVLWVGLDNYYPKLGEIFHQFGLGDKPKESVPWNPFVAFKETAALGWFFVLVRILGSSIVVPPIEEVFYRSFLYRWIARPDFQSVPLNRFDGKAFVITAVIFGFAHHQWLAGILCAMAYQWLVLRKNRLGDAMTAHAITNCLLGIWIVWKDDWKFW